MEFMLAESLKLKLIYLFLSIGSINFYQIDLFYQFDTDIKKETLSIITFNLFNLIVTKQKHLLVNNSLVILISIIIQKNPLLLLSKPSKLIYIYSS